MAQVSGHKRGRGNDFSLLHEPIESASTRHLPQKAETNAKGSESAVMSRSARLAPASVPVADAPVASARGAWGVLPMKSHGLGAGAAKRAASSTTAPSKSGPLVPAGPGDSIDVSGDEDAAASVGVGSRGRRAVAAAQKTHTASHGAEARAQSAAAAAPAVNSPAASNGAHGGAAAHPQHLFAPGSGPGLLSPHLLARVAGVANEDVADDALPAPSSMRGEGAHRRSGTASGRSSLSSSRSATKHASPSARPSAAAAPSAAVAPPFPPAGAASAVPASPPRSGRASASPGSPSDRLSTSSYSSVAPGAPRKGPRPAHNPAAAAHRRAMLATGASPGGSSMRRSLFTEESDDDDGDRSTIRGAFSDAGGSVVSGGYRHAAAPPPTAAAAAGVLHAPGFGSGAGSGAVPAPLPGDEQQPLGYRLRHHSVSALTHQQQVQASSAPGSMISPRAHALQRASSGPAPTPAAAAATADAPVAAAARTTRAALAAAAAVGSVDSSQESAPASDETNTLLPLFPAEPAPVPIIQTREQARQAALTVPSHNPRAKAEALLRRDGTTGRKRQRRRVKWGGVMESEAPVQDANADESDDDDGSMDEVETAEDHGEAAPIPSRSVRRRPNTPFGAAGMAIGDTSSEDETDAQPTPSSGASNSILPPSAQQPKRGRLPKTMPQSPPRRGSAAIGIANASITGVDSPAAADSNNPPLNARLLATRSPATAALRAAAAAKQGGRASGATGGGTPTSAAAEALVGTESHHKSARLLPLPSAEQRTSSQPANQHARVGRAPSAAGPTAAAAAGAGSSTSPVQAPASSAAPPALPPHFQSLLEAFGHLDATLLRLRSRSSGGSMLPALTTLEAVQAPMAEATGRDFSAARLAAVVGVAPDAFRLAMRLVTETNRPAQAHAAGDIDSAPSAARASRGGTLSSTAAAAAAARHRWRIVLEINPEFGGTHTTVTPQRSPSASASSAGRVDRHGTGSGIGSSSASPSRGGTGSGGTTSPVATVPAAPVGSPVRVLGVAAAALRSRGRDLATAGRGAIQRRLSLSLTSSAADAAGAALQLPAPAESGSASAGSPSAPTTEEVDLVASSATTRAHSGSAGRHTGTGTGAGTPVTLLNLERRRALFKAALHRLLEEAHAAHRAKRGLSPLDAASGRTHHHQQQHQQQHDGFNPADVPLPQGELPKAPTGPDGVATAAGVLAAATTAPSTSSAAASTTTPARGGGREGRGGGGHMTPSMRRAMMEAASSGGEGIASPSPVTTSPSPVTTTEQPAQASEEASLAAAVSEARRTTPELKYVSDAVIRGMLKAQRQASTMPQRSTTNSSGGGLPLPTRARHWVKLFDAANAQFVAAGSGISSLFLHGSGTASSASQGLLAHLERALLPTAVKTDLTGGPAATHSADAAPTPAPPPSSAASASSSAVAAAAPPPGLRELAWAELKSSRLGPYLRLKGGAAGNLAALRARIAAAAAAVQ